MWLLQGGLVESFHMMLACLDFSIRFGKTHASAPADGNSQEAAEASQTKEPVRAESAWRCGRGAGG